MVSLYKRAAPEQERILRIVEGAVLNTADAHKVPRDRWMARSIAKRAAGTLTAQWPEVLAASTRLPAKAKASGGFKCLACERRAHTILMRARSERTRALGGVAGRKSSQLLRRLPLLTLWDTIKKQMWSISRSGDVARIEAYRDLLRMISKLHRDTIAAELDGTT